MNLMSLMAELSLDGSGFQKGLQDAEKQGKSAGSKLEKTFNRIGTAIKAAFSVIAIRKVTNEFWGLINSVATFGDTIDKQSQQLGMSRRAYQEWDYILGQNGASIDDMTMSMKTMNAQILSGSEESKKAFKSLGADIDMLAAMPMENQFDYLVQLFQQMPASAEKMALATQLFGRNGQALMPLLNQTRDSTNALRQEAEDLGLIMSDEDVDASVAFGDALDALKRSFTALRNDIGSKFLPTLTKFLRNSIDYVKKLRAAYKDNGITGVFKTIWQDISAAVSWDKIKEIGGKIISTIASGIGVIKVDLAEKLGLFADGEPAEPENTSWLEIGGAIIRKIWNGFTGWVADTKANLAEKFGVQSEADDEASWLAIGSAIISKIWNGLKSWSAETKINLAQKLGIQAEADKAVTWIDIGTGIIKKIWNGITKANNTLKVNLANIFKLTDDAGNPLEPENTTWVDIGKEVFKRIKNGLSEAPVKLSNLLGITDESGEIASDWGTLGKGLIDKMFSLVSSGGEWLKKLILGESYVEGESDWTAVGNEIWGWITKAFAGKDLIGTLLEGTGDKVSGILSFVGNIVDAISTYINQNSDKVVGIIKSILQQAISILGDLLDTLIPVLVDILKDESIWSAVADMLMAVIKGMGKVFLDAIFGEGTYDKIFGNTGSKTDKQIAAEAGVAGAAAAIGTGMGLKAVGATAVLGAGGTAAAMGGLGATAAAVGYLASVIRDEQANSGRGAYSRHTLAAAEARDNLSEDWYTVPIANAIDSWIKGRSTAYRNITGEAGNIPMADETPVTPYVSMDEWNRAMGKGSNSSEKAASANDKEADSASNAAGGLDAVSSASASASDALGGLSERVGGMFWGSDDGSHASGLWTVPYDNYIARLHRGERVLTASQTRHAGEGSMSTAEITRAIKEAMGELIGSMNIVLNNKTVGKAVGDSVTNRVNTNISWQQRRTAFGHGG